MIFRRSLFNKVQLVGRVGSPSVFYPSSYSPEKGMIRFSIVTEHSVYTGQDSYKREHVWHRIAYKSKERVYEKGMLVAIDGSLRNVKKADGSTLMIVRADSCTVLAKSHANESNVSDSEELFPNESEQIPSELPSDFDHFDKERQ